MDRAVFRWDGKAMVPKTALAGEQYEVGEFYNMEVIAARSWKSHKHYFAELHEGWANLPEKYDLEWWAQSAGHLRAYALIRTGWAHNEVTLCDSEKEAIRWATRVRPQHKYGIVIPKAKTVVEYWPVTQAVTGKHGMGFKDFQKSKDAVLNFISDLTGVTREQLSRAAQDSPAGGGLE